MALNVAVIKLMSYISSVCVLCVSQGSGMLTAGAVFRSFTETLFWNGDGKRPNPVTMVS